jgi:hypothetical protein
MSFSVMSGELSGMHGGVKFIASVGRVNKTLNKTLPVALPEHAPNAESNELIYQFFEHFSSSTS